MDDKRVIYATDQYILVYSITTLTPYGKPDWILAGIFETEERAIAEVMSITGIEIFRIVKVRLPFAIMQAPTLIGPHGDIDITSVTAEGKVMPLTGEQK